MASFLPLPTTTAPCKANTNSGDKRLYAKRPPTGCRSNVTSPSMLGGQCSTRLRPCRQADFGNAAELGAAVARPPPARRRQSAAASTAARGGGRARTRWAGRRQAAPGLCSGGLEAPSVAQTAAGLRLAALAGCSWIAIRGLASFLVLARCKTEQTPLQSGVAISAPRSLARTLARV